MKKFIFRSFWILFFLFLFALVFMIGYFYPRVPNLNTQLFDFDQNAIIYDKFDQPYQNLQGNENRQIVTSEQIPVTTKNAFIAIEDKRFYSHPGVDIFGIGRALMEVFLNKDLTGSGGSTITQQLIKLTHLTSERSIERKFDEWVLAFRLEQIYSKDQILTAYLNKVNFHGAEGIQAASRQYFGKNASELDLAESAILAAIPNSPVVFDPYTYDAGGQIIYDTDGKIVLNTTNKDRAHIVLEDMFEQGYIDQAAEEAAFSELELHPSLQYNNPNRVYSYFTDAVYFQLLEDLTTELGLPESEIVKFINTSGLKIYSTVDPNLQETLESASLNDSLFPGRSNTCMDVERLTGIVYTPEVGMTMVNNADGSVCAMVGGRNNNASLTLNRATTPFQTGSSTKPITTYAPALEEKIITLASIYNDSPVNLGGWQPQNSTQTYSGPITVRDAIVHSVNTVAVRVFCDLGTERSVEYAHKLGLEVPDVDKTPAALALGGYTEGFSTMDMAAAYSCFARGGEYIKPYLYRRVEDSEGNVLIDVENERERVFSEGTCVLINEALKQAAAAGTTQINIGGTDVAGKTGTTDNLIDAWFCGYTPNYTMAVWYGYDTNKVDVGGQTYPLAIEVTGGSKPGPAGMFEYVMQNVHQPTAKFFSSPDIVTVDINRKTGKKTSQSGDQTFKEVFVKGTQPD